MKLIVTITILVFAFTANAFIENDSQVEFDNSKECFKKHQNDVTNIKNKLIFDLKVCKISEYKKSCIKEALNTAKSSSADVLHKIQECITGPMDIESEEVIFDFDDDVNQEDSSRRKCIEKYKDELLAIKKSLASDLNTCKTSENHRLCAKEALNKAKESGAAVAKKIHNCVAGNLKSEEEYEDFDFDGEISTRKFCMRKYRDEIREINKELGSKLKNCKSSEDRKSCIKEALENAKTEHAEIAKKIQECITENETEEQIHNFNFDLIGVFDEEISAHKECLKKHKDELLKIKQDLISDLKSCKSALCVKESLNKAKIAGAKVIAEIRKCIADNSRPEQEQLSFDDIEFIHDSVQKVCMEKYGKQLKEIKDNLVRELNACQSSEKLSCAKDAIENARSATAEVAEKIRKCIAEGSEN